mgnify:CR=1 FL=1
MTIDTGTPDTGTPRSLLAQPITAATFRPYGQFIQSTDDGKGFDKTDAQLDLSQGIPRLYIMQLRQTGLAFDRITRHQRCTQCLGALGDQDWFMAVAPPGTGDRPDLSQLAVFQIPPHCFIKLEAGTWHAGPHFDQASMDFYNLELSDTNITDHQTCDLRQTFGLTFNILAAAVG